MSRSKVINTSGLFAALLMIGLVANSAMAQDVIAMSDLTDQQYQSLSDGQVIVSGERRTTLGEIREADQARQASLRSYIENSVSDIRLLNDQAHQDAIDAHLACSDENANEIEGIMAHYRRVIADNPQLIREAEERSERRREVHQLWLESTRAETSRQVKRIERQLKKVNQ